MSVIDQLHEIAKERGWKCLAESCKNTHEVLWWECDKGHTWEASPVRLKLSVKVCPVCSRASKSSRGIKRKTSSKGTKRKTIADMHVFAAKRVGRCLSKVYKGAHSKLLWECSEGHQWEAIPNSIKSGSWCPVCAGNARYTIVDMQNVAAEHSGKCLSHKYTNNITKLEWECSEGHRWEAMPMKVLSGNWCRKCYNAKRSSRSQKEQAA
jgi:hypothetical protein